VRDSGVHLALSRHFLRGVQVGPEGEVRLLSVRAGAQVGLQDALGSQTDLAFLLTFPMGGLLFTEGRGDLVCGAAVRRSPFVLVRGRLQWGDEVFNLVAEKVVPGDDVPAATKLELTSTS